MKFTAVAEGVCGTNTVVNRATANTANGTKADTANVVVNKPCNVPVPVPELPQTGPAEGILTIAGLAALTAGIAYAVRSNRVRNLLRR